MLKSGCARRRHNADGSETIEPLGKDDEYYELLDETAKLATIRAAKWIHFWSILGIVILVISLVISVFNLLSNPAINEMLNK